MELKITGMEAERKSIDFNYSELRQQITEKADFYKNLVYDDESIRAAKTDRATLNKFKSALSDKKREVKNDCLKPFEDFEKKVNDLISIIDEPILAIDTKIKSFEEQEKQEKRLEIVEMFTNAGFQPFVKFESIFNPKWLNKTFSLKKVEDELAEKRNAIGHDIATINALQDFSFEALEEYKRTLDLNRAIQEGQRLADIQRRKAEAKETKGVCEREAAAKEPPVSEKISAQAEETQEAEESTATDNKNDAERQWVSFKALVSIEQAEALGNFCRANGIELKMI